MDLSNVQSPHGITLVGAGPLKRLDLVEFVALAPTLVAADGGANFCVSAGFLPEAVIGDLDSILPKTRAALPDARFIQFAEQDTTDFEKCMERVDAPFVLAAGFASGRLDHMLAVLSVMARDVGPPVILMADQDILFAAPKEITLDVKAGTRVLVISTGRGQRHVQRVEMAHRQASVAPNGNGRHIKRGHRPSAAYV